MGWDREWEAQDGAMVPDKSGTFQDAVFAQEVDCFKLRNQVTDNASLDQTFEATTPGSRGPVSPTRWKC